MAWGSLRRRTFHERMAWLTQDPILGWVWLRGTLTLDAMLYKLLAPRHAHTGCVVAANCTLALDAMLAGFGSAAHIGR